MGLLSKMTLIMIASVSLNACQRKEAPSEPAKPQSVELNRSVTESAELSSRIYRTLFAKSLDDRKVFEGWANVLSQGASIEGVYRGMILSKEYQALENAKPAICAKGLAFFAQEAAVLKKKPKEEFMARFKSAPFFAVKRVLGEALLQHIDEISADRPRLARGFAKFVERSKLWDPSGDYEKWALTAPIDSIKWEALNRLHRVLNEECMVEFARPQAAKPAATQAMKPVDMKAAIKKERK